MVYKKRKNFFNLEQNWSKLGIKCVKVDKGLSLLSAEIGWFIKIIGFSLGILY